MNLLSTKSHSFTVIGGHTEVESEFSLCVASTWISLFTDAYFYSLGFIYKTLIGVSCSIFQCLPSNLIRIMSK